MNTKIYVWGTGIILARILEYRISISQIEAFIDNNGSKTKYMGKRVIRPTELGSDYGAIIVANTHTDEIYSECQELGLDLSKVIFLYNNVKTIDINKNYELISKVLGADYADIIRTRYHLVRNISKDEINTLGKSQLCKTEMYMNDYVRVKTLELVADEIRVRKIEGEIAELGVFKGEFSECLNISFPDRKLYLFDTFEGFDRREAEEEKKNGSCTEVFIDSFKRVNIEKVLERMPYPDQIVIKQGLFPDTAVNIEEKFAFVSLDVDFEESTLKGLEFFYPRLTVGGYMFIHDYNYGYFDCVKKAVEDFENIHHISLCKIPICDAIGTMVITK